MKWLFVICSSLVFLFSLILFLYPVIDKNIYLRKKKLYEYTKALGLDNKYYLFSRASTIILIISSILVLVISLLVM